MLYCNVIVEEGEVLPVLDATRVEIADLYAPGFTEIFLFFPQSYSAYFAVL